MTESEFVIHTEAMRRDGFAILPGSLTHDECDAARRELDRLWADREPGGFECLFNKARIFERFYQIPTLLRFIRHFLGEDAFMSSMHGSILEPGSGAGGLHADGAITGHLRDASMAVADGGRRITSHVIALNTIHCISDFTSSNGATQLVPGSHLNELLEIPEGSIDKACIAAATRGSTIVFNANAWHGTSENRTAERRHAVLSPWRRFWTRGEYELPRLVRPDVLERAGADGRRIFAIDALEPYLELWQWDRRTGAPKTEYQGLQRP
jgi:ectoine hydroxylase-related dioxygenase (phytanoyl-CoA dioxygenase family)